MRRSLILLLIVAFLPGCDALLMFMGHTHPVDGSTGSSELKRFESEQEVADYFSEQITERNMGMFGMDVMRGPAAPGGEFADAVAAEGGAAPPASPVAGEAGGDEAADGSFSQTTIQEEGVDEADVVKTDGSNLYVIDDSLLRIVGVSDPDSMSVLGEVELDGFGREIYLYEKRVIALTETFGNFYYGGGGFVGGPEIIVDPIFDGDVAILEAPPEPAQVDGGEPADEAGAAEDERMMEPPIDEDILPGGSEPRFERPKTIVTVIDVTSPGDPQVLSTTSFDGSLTSSRMIAGVLHLVVANFQGYYFDVLPLLGRPELDVSEVDVPTLLPHFEREDSAGVSSGPVLTWEELYRPVDPDGFGVLSVVSMDTESAEFTAVGIVAEPGLLYASPDALYLTDSNYDFLTGSPMTRQTTDIYKFDYIDDKAVPVATGTVPGRPLNQYSMGEYNDYLRIATTVDAAFFGMFGRTEAFNNVYVLGQIDGSLEVTGKVENIAPGEQIKSARFVGDRGFVVTFREVDPLFTLDMSDPSDPRIIAELKVPGFSTFLLPMDADHLLAVGQYIPEAPSFGGRGVQLSIFDVSDMADPRRTFDVVLGAEGSADSEALYNPKALTYFPESGLVALPVSVFNFGPFMGFGEDFDVLPIAVEPVDSPDGQTLPEDGDSAGAPPEEPVNNDDFDGVIVFRVSSESGFEELGRISTVFEKALYPWSTFTRGVFIDDDVFAVTNNGVRGAPISDVSSAPFELVFEPAGPVENAAVLDDNDTAPPREPVETASVTAGTP